MSNWIIFTSHSLIGNFCWNGIISFEILVETEISCCAPRFPLILTAKFHSLHIKESGVGVGNFGKAGVGVGSGSRKFWKDRSCSRIFYLRLRNPGRNIRNNIDKVDICANILWTLHKQLEKCKHWKNNRRKCLHIKILSCFHDCWLCIWSPTHLGHKHQQEKSQSILCYLPRFHQLHTKYPLYTHKT